MKIRVTVELENLELELRAARLARGLSFQQLSTQIALMGGTLVPESIRKVELNMTKEVPLETLQLICQVLGIDIKPKISSKLFSRSVTFNHSPR